MVGLTRQQAIQLQLQTKEARKVDLNSILELAYKSCPYVEDVDRTIRKQIEFHPFKTKHLIEVINYNASDMIVDHDEIEFVHEEVEKYLKSKYITYFPDCKIKDMSLDKHIIRYALELLL